MEFPLISLGAVLLQGAGIGLEGLALLLVMIALLVVPAALAGTLAGWLDRRKNVKKTAGRTEPVKYGVPSSQAPPLKIASESKPPSVSTGVKPIFISYRRQDSSDVTGRIYDRLAQRFGKEAVFKDVDSIPLGVDFRRHLSDSVGQCNLLLAVIGKQWLGSEGGAGKHRLDESRDYIRIEIEAALQRNIPVIPLLVQGAELPEEEDLPPSLQSLAYHNAIAIRPDPDFHQDMERLIRGIEFHLEQ